ncbi:metal-dependent hydrolase [Halorientalis halophila]|uniref:metal-dependent hydrolase n=1 Tax=Halorientalis halophila TaxID=3108499 RepID=UPI00300AEE45
MWPWGHAAVGYLLYTVYRRKRFDLRPHGVAVVALAVGTQLPDLIDKPLAWQYALLPNGRSLGHSLVVALLLVALLWVVARRVDAGESAVAFGVGYVGHLFGDAFYHVLAGEFYYLGFLGWPLVPAVEYDLAGKGFLASLLSLELGPDAVFELGLALIAMALWYRHGCPGLSVLLPGYSEGDPGEQPE